MVNICPQLDKDMLLRSFSYCSWFRGKVKYLTILVQLLFFMYLKVSRIEDNQNECDFDISFLLNKSIQHFPFLSCVP